MSKRYWGMLIAGNNAVHVATRTQSTGFWIAAILLLCLLTGFFYCFIRINNLRKLTAQLITDLDSEKTCIALLAEEREFLIREIHHRVKNNLQIMMSLLNMQSAYLYSNEALGAIKDSSHRLYAISLVHQKLYQTETLSAIDVPVYLNELGQYLLYEFNSVDRVRLRINADPLLLDVNSAIPLGLIVQEALSNALRHAYAPGQKGAVNINLHSEDEFQYLLQIADDGAGLPKGADMQNDSSLGKTLMAGLSGQLHGKLAIHEDQGVTVTLVFPKNLDHLSTNTTKRQ